jgi:hypothetical protein
MLFDAAAIQSFWKICVIPSFSAVQYWVYPVICHKRKPLQQESQSVVFAKVTDAVCAC